MGAGINYDELARRHGGTPAEMPDKIVEVPGVGNVSFPGGMDDSAISEAIKRHLAKQSAVPIPPGATLEPLKRVPIPPGATLEALDYDALAAQHGGRPQGSEFQNLSLPDKNQYLLENSPTFAKMPPKDRSEYLNKIHYGPAAKPAEDTSSIWGGVKSALGEQAKGAAQELKNPLSYLPLPGPLSIGSQISAVRSHYPLVKRAAQETWEGMKHPLTPPAPLAGLHRAEAVMPIAGPMAAGVEEPAMAGHTREAIGRGLVYGSELAAPVLGGRLAKATEPIRGRMAERVAQSLLGPEPKGTPAVSRPAPAVVAEGPVAVSQRSLTTKIGKALGEHEATVRRTLAASKGAPHEPLEPIVRKAVKPLMDEARDLGHPEIADRVRGWAERYLAAHPAEVSLEELHNLRKRMGSNQALFKGTSEEFSDLKTAQKEVYRGMNEAMDRRMPGIRAVTERQSGLIRARQMLKEQARREAGGPLLPMPRLYGGESPGGGFMAMRFGLGIPGETALKTLAVKALGNRVPLAEPTPARPFVAPPPPELRAVTPPQAGGMSIERLRALRERLEAERMAAESAAPVSPLGRGTLARLPEVAVPPEIRATLPGLGQAVLENRAAAGRFRGQELGREFNAPRENVSAATGEMERESPLFRETGAGGQEGLFSKAEAARPAIAAPQPIPESRHTSRSSQGTCGPGCRARASTEHAKEEHPC
jgi:hypothetical protein